MLCTTTEKYNSFVSKQESASQAGGPELQRISALSTPDPANTWVGGGGARPAPIPLITQLLF